jgi:beta-glucosidase-like glycosyl hydrolase
MTPGRLVIPALRWQEDTGFGHEEAAIEAALRVGVGGFILFGGTEESVRRLTADLRKTAGRPLLIAADLERGAGQQVAGLPELPPPLALASLQDESVVRGAGLSTALVARSVGINWVLAPVADLDLEPDNPIVQTRAFGNDPWAVASLVAAWISGCEGGGALSCAKHFPGHGRTRLDSHDTLPTVMVGADRLRDSDLVPFRAAVGAGVSTIMTAHVAYPLVDPSAAPATFSRSILRLLREEMGFGGLIVSDALVMEGARPGGGTEAEAAVAALGAGVDVLLYPADPAVTVAALVRAAANDPKIAARLEDALARYERVTSRLPEESVNQLDAAASAMALGDWLLSRPPRRGPAPVLQAPIELIVVDDDLDGRYPPSSPSTAVAEHLASRGVPLGPGGSRVLLAFAEPRASKGRAGFGAESLRALRAHGPAAAQVIVFGHPRLAEQVPPGPPILVAWHRQRLMQDAAARWLLRRFG